MNRRAAIYVRVSSERQAEKASPQAQEEDCRAYCESRGYTVVEVYRDVEKYRVGKRLVDPSGTRADRPQLKRVLADAHAGAFEVIVAWREDRLYRSYRPMLDVLECIEQTKVDIEIVKETFDKNLAPVKAWAARMELAAKHDRLMMGGAKRLAEGKDWIGIPPYGYRKEDGRFQIDPEESGWVLEIWRWFGEGLSGRTIRQRLIGGNAPQRIGGKYPWSVSFIYQMLKKDYYHAGHIKRHWGGTVYEIPIPSIVDGETALCVRQRFARYRPYPAGNIREHALAAGLAYCKTCNVKMMVISRKKRGRTYAYYKCFTQSTVGERSCGCAGSAKMGRIDAELWKRVWALIAEPGEFERRLEARIAALQAEEVDAEAACERLERRLDDLAMNRQQVITWALQKTISEADLELRLAGMTIEQNGIEREMNDKRLLVGNRAERLIELAALYRERVRRGAEGINDAPISEEHARRQFELRRKFVEGLVTRVDVLPDKTIEVHAELELAPGELGALPISEAIADRR